MYEIRQFRQTLYLLVLMGICGFAMAAEMPAFGLAMVLCVLVNVWLVGSGHFVPMPRWLAAGITLVAAAYTVLEVMHSTTTVLLLVGQFLAFVQIVKLFEQRANRDFSQLLILSSLLMVASSISTGSVVFALLLIVYLVLSLHCWLLFHLKVNAEAAYKAQTIPPEKLNAATLRQDQRYLPRSMRRFTLIIAGAALCMGVVIFLVAPRNSGGGLFAELQFHIAPPLTGFSDHISFQDVARITQNQQVVARVWVDRPVEGGILVLRGRTLDHYENKVWSHTEKPKHRRMPDYPGEKPQPRFDGPTSPPSTTRSSDAAPTLWRQHIVLYPIGQPTLFCMAGPINYTTDAKWLIIANTSDLTLWAYRPANMPEFVYDVNSTNELGREPLPYHEPSVIDKEITRIANDPGVCGQRGGISLALRRAASTQPSTQPSPDDAEIAANIEKYLRTHYTYTLDLSSDREVLEQGDPLAAFLTKVKKGHCEYFAGAMTLLCQSLGMQARIVCGFKCDEFNSAGGYFEVRQSHAHAWVEVLTESGWKSYDPTSSTTSGAHKGSILRTLRNWYDYLQYTWGNSVVAYSGSLHDSLMSRAESQLSNAMIHHSLSVSRWRWPPRWLKSLKHWWEWNGPGPRFFSLACMTVGLVLIAWAARLRLERWRLRRRAARIGLDALTRAERFRIARQVGFYDQLIRLLEKRGLRRAPSQTPLEFVESSRAAHAIPLDACEVVRRLTCVFYRVRFGSSQLTAAQQRRLHGVVASLANLLTSPPRTPPLPGNSP